MNQPSRRVAIIGSGPAAFYAAIELLRTESPEVWVDMLERLPTPYGLVRGGVAPDHQKIKAVTKIYERAAGHPRFRFFGNVEFGRDVQREDLLCRYDSVLYAIGSRTDRHLGIPGENLVGSHPATEFVGWYNGHPDYRHLTFDLSAERVAIIGMGNVAIDCARILTQDPDELAKTDIADHALEQLRQSKVKQVYLIGRRGPVQAAFTPAEARELLHLPSADALVRASDLVLDACSQEELNQAARNTQLNFEILQKIQQQGDQGKARKLHILFYLSPKALLGQDRVEQLELVRNVLIREGGSLRAKPTEQMESLPVDLVFRSIGYLGEALPGLPFDARKGVLPNEQGQLLDAPGGNLLSQEFTAGWIKRGPSGVIGTNKPDSIETVNRMRSTWEQEGAVSPRNAPDLLPWLQERGVRVVEFRDWKKLDAHEVQQGEDAGRPRVKVCDVSQMLKVIEAP